MAKKHKHEEHVNHEAWAIPYGDLVTLLLAFFVVMYSISSVNEGKYRVLSQSMVAAFNGKPKSMTPIQVGEHPVTGSQMSVMDSLRPAAPATDLIPRSNMPGIPQTVRSGLNPERVSAQERDARGRAMRELRALASAIEKAMAPLIDDKLIVVRRSEQWLEVEIKTDILFPSGIATIAPNAQAVLDELAAIFARFSNSIRVEGYTDDRPINTAVFPSNWELSAARAASVVRRFAEHGVAPDRLGIIGWGEQRPVASNDSAEGRNQNRRVLIVVLGNGSRTERAISDPANGNSNPLGTLLPDAAGATDGVSARDPGKAGEKRLDSAATEDATSSADSVGNLLKPSRAVRPSEPRGGEVKAQPAQQALSRSDRIQGARSGRFRHPASRDTCTSMCIAGTAVYEQVHEDSEHRATQQSGRAAGFKRFPLVEQENGA